jgi:hypothetical protein
MKNLTPIPAARAAATSFSRFFSAPSKGTFNHRTNCFIQRKEALELLFAQLLQE